MTPVSPGWYHYGRSGASHRRVLVTPEMRLSHSDVDISQTNPDSWGGLAEDPSASWEAFFRRCRAPKKQQKVHG